MLSSILSAYKCCGTWSKNMVAEIVVNPTTIRSRPQRPPLLVGLSFMELLLIALYDQRNFHWLTLLLWQVDWTIYLYSFLKLYDIVLYSVYPSVLFPTIYGVSTIQHYAIVCQWLASGQWFFQGILVSFTKKNDCHDITEILLKVVLNTITLTSSNQKVN